jgi:uncharacterized protein YlzI (FlbEa/FlbD family)
MDVKFIKLTKDESHLRYPDPSIYFNVLQIGAIETMTDIHEERTTYITVASRPFAVKESIEEILQKIKEA